LLSGNQVSFALDGWTSTNKLAIMMVMANSMDRPWVLQEVQLAFDEVDGLFFSHFKIYLRMIGQGLTYWHRGSGAFERYDLLF
jgi:hypothetical protein